MITVSEDHRETPVSGRPVSLPGGLHCIDLPQPLPGFRRFISAWLFTDPLGRRVLVDPGPADTIPLLIRELESLTDGIDLILLTHIHLDHSGGVGRLCARFPGARVLAHPRAFRHLTDPEKLWRASVETLGDVARTYGPPAPVDGAVLIEKDEAGLVEVFPTPGHAPHHLAFRVSCGDVRLLFVGEAAGLTLPTESGELWLRPTTPPCFDAAAALESLDRVASVLVGDELLCYAHWGAYGDARKRVALARSQVSEWLDIVAGMRNRPPEAIAGYLLEHDPLLRASLPEDLLERERLFIGNSVLGFLGFLAGPAEAHEGGRKAASE